MEDNNSINISVIVAAYNVEEYLSTCLDSLLMQDTIRLEIIIVDDGSTDHSNTIADQYANNDSRIKVIHQKNRGASAARNTGLKFAQGEYIVFVDSDDWLQEDTLGKLYNVAITYQADVVMGNILLCGQDGSINNSFCPVKVDMPYIPITGKEGFVFLNNTGSYLPMQFRYIYRRDYLEKTQAQFEEGIMHEDELWMPIVLCNAEKMVITDIKFYYYRIREGSVMNETGIYKRLDSLFKVTDKLMGFADCFDFSGEDSELKNWLYVNIFRLYANAFSLVSGVKDTSYLLPEHHLDRFCEDCWTMLPEPQKICNVFFRKAKAGLKKYTNWRSSEWVASIASQINVEKKLMLIYNCSQNEDLSLKIEDVPTDWIVTTDRRYFQQANAVVFLLPDLYSELENELEQPQGQIWVASYLESNKDEPWINNLELRNTFNLWMCYRQDTKEEHPLVRLCKKISKNN